MAAYVMRTGLADGSTVDLREFRSNSQIPTVFPRIDVRGRALGKDEKGPAIQTTSTSKVRRVELDPPAEM
jgi:hypothetical protein